MNRFLSLIVGIVSTVVACASTSFSSYRGVWANDCAEAVITDSVCIVYIKSDNTMQAVIEIPSAGILHKTVFSSDGSVSFPSASGPFEISENDGVLTIYGQNLKKVEDFKTVYPYEMTVCTSRSDVGKCLQEWNLGVKYGEVDGMPCCEICTNRHMFVYMVNPSMVYIRAAAARNNDNGTLFFQNIRMMKNNNTGEYTMHIIPDNFKALRNDLEIDNSKFRPDACTFNPDGGIYWSLISFSPDEILLNGCGDIYKVQRAGAGEDLQEWIGYEPYSTDNELLPSLR